MRLSPSEITPLAVWQGRRQFMRAALPLVGGAAWPALAPAAAPGPVEPSSTLEQISRYNNYYEFSSNKEAVWKLAEDFHPLPWTLRVEGEVENPRTWALEDLLRRWPQEERIYRLRCVEGWSQVVPWRGFPLQALLKEGGLTSRAKFVVFESVLRPQEMVGQRRATLAWPYSEALRIDEAMHPLTLMVSGVYGQALPVSNGAPLRLAVPWKYGFKSIKAITRIRLVESAPQTTWVQAAPTEYGFYGNVNPEVPHPRWSQRREVRVGENSKRATLPFNGYAAEVAQLYSGMDLQKYF
jgi:sulfoxide reductase catalytic subunit YedY